MHIESFREYCISKSGVTEEFPFGDQTLVFKVLGKVFALANIELFDSVNLKCDPEWAIELRERYVGIQPGYHMNKKHWNTVSVSRDVPDSLFFELIDHSYNLVVKNLPKRLQDELQNR